MPTVEELVVSAKPEGIDETTQDINKMEEELNESAEQMGDTAGEFGAMGRKWKGAMGAIVGGLAVAAGGLLSQVPVIGEKMGQLNGIIDAVAFKIGQDLRPSMTVLGKDLAETETEVANSENSLEAISTAFEGFEDAVQSWQAQSLATIIEDTLGFDVDTKPIKAVIELMQFDFIGAWQTAASWVGDKTDGMGNDIDALSDTVFNMANNLWSDAKTGVSNFTDNFESEINTLVDDAMQWGEDLAEGFVSSIKEKLRPFIDIFKDLASGDVGTAAGAAVDIATGGGGGGGGTTGTSAGGDNPLSVLGMSPLSEGDTFMDARKVNTETGRIGKNRVNRRGGG